MKSTSAIPSTYMVIGCPTPQRTPTLDRLAAGGLAFHVIYLQRGSPIHSWGESELHHPHTYWSQLPWLDRVCLTGRLTFSQKPRNVALFGYRGLLRSSALLAAHANRKRVFIRSDTNQKAIEDQPHSRRLARKALLRVLIPRRTTAWTIGSQNERFWKGEVGLHNLVRIPYETPVLPGLLDSASVPRRETDPERVHVTYVGRLVDIKGIEDLVCAFAVLDHDAYAEWKLTVVGDGPMREKLRALAAEDRRVRFVGALPYEALGQHMLQCDVLVLPSTTEPWGLVVNEALGLGLYVIASDRVGAADDLLVDGAGKVFPAGDIDALSQALRECAALTARIPVHPRTDTALLMRKSIEDL